VKKEKTVTLTLDETQFGIIFNAYLDCVDSALCSENLTDEEKNEHVNEMRSTGMLLWNALPVFFPIDSLVRKPLMNIDWGYYEGYHDEPQS